MVNFLLSADANQLRAFILLGSIAFFIVVFFVFFILSIRASRKYNSSTLPDLPGLIAEEELLKSVETDEDNTPHAFSFEFDEIEDISELSDQSALDILNAARSQESTENKGVFPKRRTQRN